MAHTAHARGRGTRYMRRATWDRAFIGHASRPARTHRRTEHSEIEDALANCYCGHMCEATDANHARQLHARHIREMRRAKRGSRSPLQLLCMEQLHNPTVEFMTDVLAHCEERLIRYHNEKPNARSRKKIKWMARWVQRLDREIESRR